MNVIVFGADGFLGRHLVQKLAKQDGVFIKAFGRFSSFERGDDHPLANTSNIEIFPGDFFNRDDLSASLEDIDYVFHLISSTSPALSTHDPFIDIDTNIRGSVQLLELCKEKNIKKVIFFSSGGSVYGQVDSESIEESTPLRPISPYGIGKATIENYLRYFNFMYNLDYVVYRIANPYGPGQRIHGRQGVVPIFMRKYIDNESIDIFGDGKMVRDYIFIDDLITMIVGSFDKTMKHTEYNLGSGSGNSINDIIAAIEKCTTKRPVKHHLPAPATYVERNVLSIERFTSEFNISPTTSLNEGIKKTWAYVKHIS